MVSSQSSASSVSSRAWIVLKTVPLPPGRGEPRGREISTRPRRRVLEARVEPAASRRPFPVGVGVPWQMYFELAAVRAAPASSARRDSVRAPWMPGSSTRAMLVPQASRGAGAESRRAGASASSCDVGRALLSVRLRPTLREMRRASSLAATPTVSGCWSATKPTSAWPNADVLRRTDETGHYACAVGVRGATAQADGRVRRHLRRGLPVETLGLGLPAVPSCRLPRDTVSRPSSAIPLQATPCPFQEEGQLLRLPRRSIASAAALLKW